MGPCVQRLQRFFVHIQQFSQFCFAFCLKVAKKVKHALKYFIPTTKTIQALYNKLPDFAVIVVLIHIFLSPSISPLRLVLTLVDGLVRPPAVSFATSSAPSVLDASSSLLPPLADLGGAPLLKCPADPRGGSSLGPTSRAPPPLVSLV